MGYLRESRILKWQSKGGERKGRRGRKARRLTATRGRLRKEQRKKWKWLRLKEGASVYLDRLGNPGQLHYRRDARIGRRRLRGGRQCCQHAEAEVGRLTSTATPFRLRGSLQKRGPIGSTGLGPPRTRRTVG
jgi:hypothetical protein